MRPTPKILRSLPVAALAATVLVACGSAGSSGSGSSSTGDDSSLTGVRAAVASAEQPLSSIPVPTDKLSGVSSLKGRTVYYVPFNQQATAFQIVGKTLGDALGRAGLKLQLCNGNNNPSAMAACIDQAVGASASAIVTDSIPYALASNAIDNARAKKIPVLITDQLADAAHPTDATLGYLPPAATKMLVDVADWIIGDSAGKATVVLNRDNDSPSTIAYADQALQEFSDKCPKCKVVINNISSANFSLIASSTSATILKTPGVGYVISEFDQFIQPTLGGVQQTGRSASVKGASIAAQLSGLQQVRAKNFLAVDAGQNTAYQGWATADAALRLILGQKLPEYSIPTRLFTRNNIGSVDLTSAAETSGAWYGPTDFPAKFAALWGVG